MDIKITQYFHCQTEYICLGKSKESCKALFDNLSSGPLFQFPLFLLWIPKYFSFFWVMRIVRSRSLGHFLPFNQLLQCFDSSYLAVDFIFRLNFIFWHFLSYKILLYKRSCTSKSMLRVQVEIPFWPPAGCIFGRPAVI